MDFDFYIANWFRRSEYFDSTGVTEMSTTIRLKGNAARGFIAASLVDADGKDALSKVSEGSPLWHQVKAEIDYRKSMKQPLDGSDGDE